MCKCTPEKRTPWCGKPGCEAPPRKQQRAVSDTFALAYASVLPTLREVARRHGYALGVHGSMQSDLDLIACPWIEDAADPEILIEALCVAVDGHVGKRQSADPNPSPRAHGRLAWAIYLNEHGGCPYLDVSVMPRLDP